MLEVLRATGRTTRLIKEAKWLKSIGKPVVVVVATARDVNEFKIKTGGTIPVIHSESPEWDWNEMRQYGLPLETEYLIDHYAIEKKFAKALTALHRFDLPMVKVGQC